MLNSGLRNLLPICFAGAALAACGGSEGSISPGVGSLPPPEAANTAPMISGSPSTSATVGTVWSFQPSASDRDGDALTFQATGLPSWASIDASTGLVSGTPAEANVGTTESIVITVSDGKASASLRAFRVTVASGAPSQPPPPGNTAPVISGSPVTSIVAGSNYSFKPTASDADQDALAFSIVGKPSWANFSVATGALTGTAEQGNFLNIRISVSDGTATVALPTFSINVTAAPANGTATLSWTAPTQNTDGSTLSPDELAGYRVYHGMSMSSLVDTYSVSDRAVTSYTLNHLASGMHYFAVSAVALSGQESALSQVGSKFIP